MQRPSKLAFFPPCRNWRVRLSSQPRQRHWRTRRWLSRPNKAPCSFAMEWELSSSGCFPSERNKPVRCLATGTPADENPRAVKTFRAWCVIVLPGAFLQTNLCSHKHRPLNYSDIHVRGGLKSSPSLRATAIHAASLSNCIPHEQIGRANSQSPLYCEQAARKEIQLWEEFSEDSTRALSTNTPGGFWGLFRWQDPCDIAKLRRPREQI